MYGRGIPNRMQKSLVFLQAFNVHAEISKPIYFVTTAHDERHISYLHAMCLYINFIFHVCMANKMTACTACTYTLLHNFADLELLS